MAYRLRSNESLTHGLRRLARAELRSAADHMRQTDPPRDEAIHEARKSLKKVRAIVHLIEADNGRRLARSPTRLRDVGRTLSQLRDADAMVKMLTALRDKNPRLLSEHTFARIRRRLSSHKRDVMETAERDGAWKDVIGELRTLRRRAKRWRPAHRGFGALAAGIDLTYRRGRKAMERARTRERAEDFHEWRKEIKALWYELRLIEACDRNIRRDVAALHRAETWLGDDHNAVVLCEELSKDASICGMIDVDRLRLAADQHQCRLRKKAITRMRRLYSRSPRAYLRRLERAWKKWQQHDATGRRRRTRHAAA
jgi:CHAD domain-containing protein